MNELYTFFPPVWKIFGTNFNQNLGSDREFHSNSSPVCVHGLLVHQSEVQCRHFA